MIVPGRDKLTNELHAWARGILVGSREARLRDRVKAYRVLGHAGRLARSLAEQSEHAPTPQRRLELLAEAADVARSAPGHAVLTAVAVLHIHRAVLDHLGRPAEADAVHAEMKLLAPRVAGSGRPPALRERAEQLIAGERYRRLLADRKPGFDLLELL
ncbi:hypothetical protein [Hamadaea tsunoensis]|uniref:hypothetical protein n=1 Tax=Hamadaea tsunoensis TaxID=53368 RepID=UPI0003F7E093|nr:hypothetical protein [Hamadaea tsunoensis]